jgi:hypothetical protein
VVQCLPGLPGCTVAAAVGRSPHTPRSWLQGPPSAPCGCAVCGTRRTRSPSSAHALKTALALSTRRLAARPALRRGGACLAAFRLAAPPFCWPRGGWDAAMHPPSQKIFLVRSTCACKDQAATWQCQGAGQHRSHKHYVSPRRMATASTLPCTAVVPAPTTRARSRRQRPACRARRVCVMNPCLKQRVLRACGTYMGRVSRRWVGCRLVVLCPVRCSCRRIFCHLLKNPFFGHVLSLCFNVFSTLVYFRARGAPTFSSCGVPVAPSVCPERGAGLGNGGGRIGRRQGGVELRGRAAQARARAQRAGPVGRVLYALLAVLFMFHVFMPALPSALRQRCLRGARVGQPCACCGRAFVSVTRCRYSGTGKVAVPGSRPAGCVKFAPKLCPP